jgi:uncharacterized OsmC-like protein
MANQVEESAGIDLLMNTEVRVAITGSPDKLVRLPQSDADVPMGMHGELAEFYGAAPGTFTPHASTLDYVVGALTACLAGTFKRALAARGVAIDPEALEVRGTGAIVKDGDVPVIRRVTVEYVLSGTAPEDRGAIERAHSVHHRGCAVSRSLEAAIEIDTSLTLA